MIKFIMETIEVDRLYARLNRKKQAAMISKHYGVTCKFIKKRDCFVLLISRGKPAPLPFSPFAIEVESKEEFHALQQITRTFINQQSN